MGYPAEITRTGSTVVCQVGSIVMLGGLIVMGLGWRQIHRARGELVTWGLYRYIRYPQYTGLFLITVGTLIQWPTLITVIMWPILMVKYLRLARSEEQDMIEAFGESYVEYRKQVPVFFPSLSRRLDHHATVFTEGE